MPNSKPVLEGEFMSHWPSNEEHYRKALHWISTVNQDLDLRKFDQKTLIGLIHELRGKAREALK